MVSSIIVCLHISALINHGHRHVHRYSCCHLVEYLWARNISTMTSKLKLNGTVINKCWQIRWGLVVVIILLHGLTTISFAAEWSYVHSAFIGNGKSFWTEYLTLNNKALATMMAGNIASSMSTIITDSYMVCVTQWELSTSAHHHLDSRFSAAGWFGDSAGSLFCFQYFL